MSVDVIIVLGWRTFRPLGGDISSYGYWLALFSRRAAARESGLEQKMR
jgi:hypothetical protein